MKKYIISLIVAILVVGLMVSSSSAAFTEEDVVPLYDYLFDVDDMGDGRDLVTCVIPEEECFWYYLNGDYISSSASGDTLVITYDYDAPPNYAIYCSTPYHYISTEGLVDDAPITLSVDVMFFFDEGFDIIGDGSCFLSVSGLDENWNHIKYVTGAPQDISINGDGVIDDTTVAATFEVVPGIEYLRLQVNLNLDFSSGSHGYGFIVRKEPVYIKFYREHVLSDSEMNEQIQDYIEAEADRQAGAIDDLNQTINNATQNRPTSSEIMTDPGLVVDPNAMASLSTMFSHAYGSPVIAGFFGILVILIPVSYILFGKK